MDLYAKHSTRAEPPYQDLLSALRETMDSFEHVYVIVDAIDECPYGSPREEVCKALTAMEKWDMPQLHLLVTSRNEVDIRKQIEPFSQQQLSIQNEALNADIQKYIREHLRSDSKLQRWKANFGDIEEALLKGACGM